MHDEILFEIPESMTTEQINVIADIMCNALPMDIPMCSDIAIMDRWGNEVDGWRYDPTK